MLNKLYFCHLISHFLLVLNSAFPLALNGEENSTQYLEAVCPVIKREELLTAFGFKSWTPPFFNLTFPSLFFLICKKGTVVLNLDGCSGDFPGFHKIVQCMDNIWFYVWCTVGARYSGSYYYGLYFIVYSFIFSSIMSTCILQFLKCFHTDIS